MSRAATRGTAGVAASFVLVLALAGCGGDAPPSTAPAPAVPASQAVATPASIALDRIGIRSTLIPTGVDGDTFEIPTAAGQASWFAPGPEPGQDGRAIVLGHVNLSGSPGVFGELDTARAGDEIVITDVQGGRRTFVVERVEQRPKAEFDPAALYARVDRPEVVLITCGGQLERDPSGRGNYRDNVYVYAAQRG